MKKTLKLALSHLFAFSCCICVGFGQAYIDVDITKPSHVDGKHYLARNSIGLQGWLLKAASVEYKVPLFGEPLVTLLKDECHEERYSIPDVDYIDIYIENKGDAKVYFRYLNRIPKGIGIRGAKSEAIGPLAKNGTTLIRLARHSSYFTNSRDRVDQYFKVVTPTENLYVKRDFTFTLDTAQKAEITDIRIRSSLSGARREVRIGKLCI